MNKNSSWFSEKGQLQSATAWLETWKARKAAEAGAAGESCTMHSFHRFQTKAPVPQPPPVRSKARASEQIVLGTYLSPKRLLQIHNII